MTTGVKILIGFGVAAVVIIGVAAIAKYNKLWWWADSGKIRKALYKEEPKVIMTPAAKKVWDHVFSQKQFANMGTAGVYSCRNIAGTNVASQHAYGNGIDFTGTEKEMATLQKYLEKHAKALNINYVIYNRQISQAGGERKKYTGVDPHTGHVHADFFPMQTGDPQCLKTAA